MGKVLKPVTDLIAPSEPEAPKLPAEPAPPPTEADKAVVEARRRFRAGFIGGANAPGSTIATSALGLNTEASTVKKRLLGE